MNRILILGGYGNFGKRIAEALAKDGVAIIIAGRNKEKANDLSAVLINKYPNTSIEAACFDAEKELGAYLELLKPTVVINTCGPFQNKNYSIAETCIANKVHYIDLADGRNFVTGIIKLGEKAKQAGVLVISGASTVPGLSSAVLEKYKNEFSQIDSLVFGISPGQKAERGLATTKAILGYAGKRLKPCAGSGDRYGWQDIYRQEYPELGKRWMANCDIPDLDLLPEHYGIKNIRFSAGMELTFMHLGIWLLSWVVRLGIPVKLEKYAPSLLRISNWFDCLGSPDGGMHMIIKGLDKQGNPHERKWFIIAGNGDGPHIPTIPAIILAKKLVVEKISDIGAKPCVGLVSLEEYMNELSEFDIEQHTI